MCTGVTVITNFIVLGAISLLPSQDKNGHGVAEDPYPGFTEGFHWKLAFVGSHDFNLPLSGCVHCNFALESAKLCNIILIVPNVVILIA